MSESTLYTPEQTKALGLYLRQQLPTEIAPQLGVTERTVQLWVQKFEWKKLRDDAPVELTLRQRINFLLWLDPKTDHQLSELGLLMKQHLGDVKKITGNAKDGSRRGAVKNVVKNNIEKLDTAALDEFEKQTFFHYQIEVLKEGKNPAINWMRFYLKSRQIGFTYLFAWEAFRNAIETGDNQIFISASKRQAEIFKNYIKQYALDIGGIDLKGKDEIQLSNGATLYFLSTNSRTAQGFHGHLYIDEVFWIPKFEQLDNLAGGMAMHSKWRTTYFSTPSTMAHEAYGKWSGDKQHGIDISHEALKHGSLGSDGVWRKIITVIDAIEGGANFFDMDKLKRKYPDEDVFNNLLMCIFLDDSKSSFPLSWLMGCKVDANDWKDVRIHLSRPVGNLPVWIGYDPSGDGEGDSGSVVVALPPKRANGAFRLVEKIRMNGLSYSAQAQTIAQLCDKYNVQEIAIDTSGIGDPVAEMVEVFFPRVTRIIYSINTKNNMVLKAREVIRTGRLQFDGGWDDLAHAFLMIKRTTTKSGQVSYVSSRTKAGGHADLAWATINLLSLEGIIIEDHEPTIVFS
jgi:uncharacterized protein YjcR